MKKNYYKPANTQPYFERIAYNVNKQARLAKVPERVTPEELETVLGRHDETVCYLCGGKMDDIGRQWRNAQIDHKVSLAKGGKNEVNNLGWTHSYCNNLKRHLTTDELLKFLKRIVNHLENQSNKS
jgi:5-methylcytosine-specific restriction endonuclease McrA